MTRQQAIDNAIAALETMDDEATFVFLAGDSNGLDYTSNAGTHEPLGVHIHLLAVHLDAIAGLTESNVRHAANLGLDAHAQMESSDTTVIAYDETGGEADV